jgi:Uma2 family endonuclease
MDMAVAAHVSVEEYLNTSYEPDMEYVDGELVERNVGEWNHGEVQSNIIFALRQRYPSIKVIPELRSKVTTTRYRVPDVCVALRNPHTRVLLEAPYIAVEILSEEDRVSRLIEKLEEYAALGTPNIWVFDPRLKRMFVFHANSLQVIDGDTISAVGEPRIELTRDEVFQD